MRKTEIILIVLAIVSILLSIVPIAGADALLILSLSVLSMLYFYLGLAYFNKVKFKNLFNSNSYKEIPGTRILLSIIGGVFLSIIVIGILFKIMVWVGWPAMLYTGWAGLICIAIVSTIKLMIQKSDFYIAMLKRFVAFSLLSIILLALPDMFLIELKYRNNPAYLQALKDVKEHPDNIDFKKRLEEERRNKWGEND